MIKSGYIEETNCGKADIVRAFMILGRRGYVIKATRAQCNSSGNQLPANAYGGLNPPDTMSVICFCFVRITLSF